MPIVIPSTIPAYKTLADANMFVMSEKRAASQDIRPLEIAILNLMPTTTVTETQLMRLLCNTPLQVHITLVTMATYTKKNTEKAHMDRHYVTFSDIKNRRFDGMIVTGAPVEKMKYEEVAYWEELKEIFAFAETNVTSTIFVCWGAQAAMYHYYGIKKRKLKMKRSGVFWNKKHSETEWLLKGTDDYIFIPHSRHTAVEERFVYKNKEVEVLASGPHCGISIAKSKDNKKIFMFGHSEYDRETLAQEYARDVKAGVKLNKPLNYFLYGEPVDPKELEKNPSLVNFSWAGTANLMYYNWLNYYVYQVTPYENV